MRTKISDLKNRARGRWPEILIAARMPPESLQPHREGPCPKCGGRDRFWVFDDVAERGSVFCRRCFNGATDPRPGDGLATLRWWFGGGLTGATRWLREFLDRNPVAPNRPEQLILAERPVIHIRWAELADRLYNEMSDSWRARAAELLGLPFSALSQLGVGWSRDHNATTWPMRDPSGTVIGIRLRCPKTARKWAVKGSKAGLIFPVDLREGMPLWVAEGPTDTAALTSLDLNAVGVPSAGARADWAAKLAQRLEAPEVIVVADGDEAGTLNAKQLVKACGPISDVRVIKPPEGFKDCRDWIVAGATADELRAVADKSYQSKTSSNRNSSSRSRG